MVVLRDTAESLDWTPGWASRRKLQGCVHGHLYSQHWEYSQTWSPPHTPEQPQALPYPLPYRSQVPATSPHPLPGALGPSELHTGLHREAPGHQPPPGWPVSSAELSLSLGGWATLHPPPPGRLHLWAQEVLLSIALLQWRGGPELGCLPSGPCSPQAPPFLVWAWTPLSGSLVSSLMFPTP